MVCFEATWFVVAFHSTPMHDPGPEEFQRPVRVCVCKGAMCCPASSVVVVGRRRAVAQRAAEIAERRAIFDANVGAVG